MWLVGYNTHLSKYYGKTKTPVSFPLLLLIIYVWEKKYNFYFDRLSLEHALNLKLHEKNSNFQGPFGVGGGTNCLSPNHPGTVGAQTNAF